MLEATSGSLVFDSPGSKQIKLRDKQTGAILKSFNISVIETVTPDEISRLLNEIANDGLSRSKKMELGKQISAKCEHGGDTQIIGKESGTLDELIRNLILEANQFTEVRIQADFMLNEEFSISKLNIKTYTKTELD